MRGGGGCQPACIRSCHGHIGGLQVGEDGAQESPPPPWTEKKKMLVLACRLAFASFACGRPPPLEASHSLSSKANLRRQWQFFFFFFWMVEKPHFHVCADTIRWSSSFSQCHGLFFLTPRGDCLWSPLFLYPFSLHMDLGARSIGVFGVCSSPLEDRTDTRLWWWWNSQYFFSRLRSHINQESISLIHARH